jgi:hypothetical protein
VPIRLRRAPVFYRVVREVSEQELGELHAAGEVRLVALSRTPNGVPRLGVLRRPDSVEFSALSPAQRTRVERAWDRGVPNEVSPQVFAELLESLQLRVLLDTHGFMHLAWSKEHALWSRRVAHPSGFRRRRRRGARS